MCGLELFWNMTSQKLWESQLEKILLYPLGTYKVVRYLDFLPHSVIFCFLFRGRELSSFSFDIFESTRSNQSYLYVQKLDADSLGVRVDLFWHSKHKKNASFSIFSFDIWKSAARKFIFGTCFLQQKGSIEAHYVNEKLNA